MKKINELTEKEANDILKFVYPNQDNHFMELSFEPIIDEETGAERITFEGNSAVGIIYLSEMNDRCILAFENTKSVLWLYRNGYDIEKFLEENSYMTQMERDYSDMAYHVSELSRGQKAIRKNSKKKFTTKYVKDICKHLIEMYYKKQHEYFK